MSIKAAMMVWGVLGALAGTARAQDGSGGPATTVDQPAPQPYPGTPPPYPAQPPSHGQPRQPGYPQPSSPPLSSPLGRGVTFELALGLGWLRFSPDGDEVDGRTESGYAGPNLGLGVWISSRTALSVRLASAAYSDDFVRLTGGFFGGALQHWVSRSAWLGAGLGIGLVSAQLQNGEAADSESALGLDLRAGFTPFISGQHSLHFSIELTPSFFDRTTLTGIGLLLGYQYL